MKWRFDFKTNLYCKRNWWAREKMSWLSWLVWCGVQISIVSCRLATRKTRNSMIQISIRTSWYKITILNVLQVRIDQWNFSLRISLILFLFYHSWFGRIRTFHSISVCVREWCFFSIYFSSNTHNFHNSSLYSLTTHSQHSVY